MFSFEKNKKLPYSTESERVLPFDVRYALQYRGAKLTASEISDLANNGFAREALYLLLKASLNTPALQQKIIEDAVSDKTSAYDETTLKSFIKEHVTKLPPNVTVDAMKLAQYSRQGFELWHQEFVAKAYEAAKRENPTFIVGHSMFVGLLDFIHSHKIAHKSLYILLPHHIKDTSIQTCGYHIQDGSVILLDKDFLREPNSIIIDDVHNTGETEKTLKDFWNKDGTMIGVTFEYVAS